MKILDTLTQSVINPSGNTTKDAFDSLAFPVMLVIMGLLTRFKDDILPVEENVEWDQDFANGFSITLFVIAYIVAIFHNKFICRASNLLYNFLKMFPVSMKVYLEPENNFEQTRFYLFISKINDLIDNFEKFILRYEKKDCNDEIVKLIKDLKTEDQINNAIDKANSYDNINRHLIHVLIFKYNCCDKLNDNERKLEIADDFLKNNPPKKITIKYVLLTLVKLKIGGSILKLCSCIIFGNNDYEFFNHEMDLTSCQQFAYTIKILVFADQNKTKEALELMDQYHQLHKTRAIKFIRGEAYYKLGYYEESTKSFNEFIDSGADNAWGDANLVGRFFQGQEDFTRAEKYYSYFYEIKNVDLDDDSYSFNVPHFNDVLSKYRTDNLLDFQLLYQQMDLVKTNSELKRLSDENQELVSGFSHTLSNKLLPERLKDIVLSIKNSLSDKTHQLNIQGIGIKIHQSYRMEQDTKLRCNLLAIRGDKSIYRSKILSDRIKVGTNEDGVGISDIIEESLRNTILDFLDINFTKFKAIRKKYKNKSKDFNELAEDYYDKVLFKEVDHVVWFNKYFGKICQGNITDNWANVNLKRENNAHAMLNDHISELLLNSFKYTDHDHKDFLSIQYSEKNIEDILWLRITFANPTKNPNIDGTQKGIKHIHNELCILNENQNNECTIQICSEPKLFKVTLSYRHDLLIANPKILSNLKAKIH